MRYETAVLLGEGGTGEVYKAFDPVLGRHVALKLLRRGDTRLGERFLREARAQARIDHELVCKVYEVGELDGRPYIAMQYVEGETLDVAAAPLSLERKLALVSQVARAVQAAHETGLVHRDLKPGNILVDRDKDGVLRPHVLDFGLAREPQSAGLTETGMLLGTPAYMAPEQARGEVRSLDRRTDVFGLGAVLYHLVTGRPPFDGESTAEVLVKVLQCEPPLPRRLAPRLPADVEAIVLKCLEREPGRRYGSARALADDLDRFLRGEPVAARAAGVLGRAWRRLRRHPGLAASGAAVLLAIGLLLGMWLRTRWVAGERIALAQRLGQEVERIDGLMRRAELLPLHDTRAERAAAGLRIRRIEAATGRLGDAGRSAREAALGRAYYALREYGPASVHLERAWRLGEHAPEVADALGRVLGALYEDALGESHRLGNRELRAVWRRQLAAALREPALRYLRGGGARSAGAAPYLLGLVAYYEERYDAALAHAGAALRADPADYQAAKLAGDVHAAMGWEAWRRGDHAAALAACTKAGAAYAAASAVARSDADVYEADCTRWREVMVIQNEVGGSLRQAFELATAACGKALAVNPESASAFLKQAHALLVWADHQQMHGTDPRPALRRAALLAGRAAALEPAMQSAWKTLGDIFSVQGSYERSHGIDAGASLRQAILLGRKAVFLGPGNYVAHLSLGVSYSVLAEYEAGRGWDPRRHLARSIEEHRSAERIDSGAFIAHANETLSWLDRAEYEADHGLDPRPALAAAAAADRRCLALNPRHAESLSAMGELLGVRAEYDLAHGRDPRPALAGAIDAMRQAMAINPRQPFYHNNLGELRRIQADFEASALARDPSADLAAAAGSYRRAIELDPGYASPHRNQAAALLVAASFRLASGASAGAQLAAARAAIDRALRLDPSAEALMVLSKVELAGARDALARGRPAQAYFSRAAAALDRAEQRGATSVTALLARAELCRWRAAARVSGGGAAAAGEQDPGEAGTILRDGLAAADRALALDPSSARAAALGGFCHLLAARAERDPARRRAAAERARGAFARALELNPLLPRDVRDAAGEARRLAAS